MDKQLEHTSLPWWQLLLYFLMISLTFIATPKSGWAYIATRGIQMIECLFLGVLLIANFKQGIRFNKFNIIVNLWWIIYTILAYMNITHQVGLTPIFKWMNIIIFLLLGSCYWQHNLQESLRYITISFSILIYLNVILLILFPDGLWIDPEWTGRGSSTRHLFGNYNQIGFVCLLGITTQALYTFSSHKGKFNLFLLTATSIFSVVFVGSMTSAVSLSLFAIFLLFHKIIKHPKRLLTCFFICYVTFFTLIVWHGYSIDEVSLATRFVEGTLSKDTSFSNRTIIWENAVELIKQSPWIGHGIQNVDWNDAYLGGSGSHNIWLMLLLQGGIIICFTFIGITFFSIKQALKTPSAITTLAVIALCILFIMSLFETYYIAQIFLLLQFIYYSPLIVEEKENNQSIQIT